jgi:Ner family transcriptional regulator
MRPWPKGEAIIANAIGVKKEVIWPSRYPVLDEAV